MQRSTANRAPRPRRRAFTLAEVLLASAVLALATAAVVNAIVVAQTQTYEALHHARANALAEALIEEILARPYDDPDAADAETLRTDFDDIDDYDQLAEPAGAVADISGQTYGGAYADFARTVAVANQQQSIAAFGDPVDGKTITVTITDSRGQTWTVTRFVPQPQE